MDTHESLTHKVCNALSPPARGCLLRGLPALLRYMAPERGWVGEMETPHLAGMDRFRSKRKLYRDSGEGGCLQLIKMGL